MKQATLIQCLSTSCLAPRTDTATLAAKIAAEKEAIMDRLKQAEMTVHWRVRDLRDQSA
jgi:hypothetical protein